MNDEPDYVLLSEKDYGNHLARVAENSWMFRNNGFNDQLRAFFNGIDLGKILRRGARVLELGCGQGNTLRDFAEEFGIVAYGVDLDFYKLTPKDRVAMFMDIGSGVRFKKGDIQNLPYEEGTFDFVFSYRAFTYLCDRLQGLKEAHRVLKIGGTGVIEAEVTFGEEVYLRKILPHLEEIIEKSHSKDQIKVERVPTTDKGLTARFSHRVVINKTSSEMLDFPRVCKPYAESFYTDTICVYEP